MRREALQDGLVKQEVVASHGEAETSAETVLNGGAESTVEAGETTTDGDGAERYSPLLALADPLPLPYPPLSSARASCVQWFRRRLANH